MDRSTNHIWNNLHRICRKKFDVSKIPVQTNVGIVMLSELLPGAVVLTYDDGLILITGPISTMFDGVFGLDDQAHVGLLTSTADGNDGIDKIVFLRNIVPADEIPSGPEGWLS